MFNNEVYMQFLVVVGLFFLVFILFALSLHFSRYKQRPESGCCGGGHCSTGTRCAEHDLRHADEESCCKDA